MDKEATEDIMALKDLSQLEKKVLSHIDEAEAIAFLQDLIRTKSISPPGDCREVAQVYADKLRADGIRAEILALEEIRTSALGYLGNGNGPTVALHAHIDTMPIQEPDQWNYEPFGGEVVDGRIYGRGSGDCKGSAAAQVIAALALKRANVELDGTLIVAGVADEERHGEAGTEWLREAGHLVPDMIVVGEQTENKICIGERGICWLELTVKGEGAHGAMPWNGVSAITGMARVIDALQKELMPRLASKKHPYLPPSSLNIGTIEGGEQTNIVPSSCTIRIDRRIHPDESYEGVRKQIEDVAQAALAGIAGISCEVRVFHTGGARVYTDPDAGFVKTMAGAARDLRGKDVKLTGYMQGSDARFYAEDGIPIVIFGPGDPKYGHAPNEHISVAELVEAAQICALTAMRALGLGDQ